MVVRYSSAGKAVLFQSGLFFNDTETASVNDVVVTTEGVVVGVGWLADRGPTQPREWGWWLDGSPAYSTMDAGDALLRQSSVRRQGLLRRTLRRPAPLRPRRVRRASPPRAAPTQCRLRCAGTTPPISAPSGSNTPSGIVCWRNVVAVGGTVDRGGGDYDQFVMVWKY